MPTVTEHSNCDLPSSTTVSIAKLNTRRAEVIRDTLRQYNPLSGVADIVQSVIDEPLESDALGNLLTEVTIAENRFMKRLYLETLRALRRSAYTEYSYHAHCFIGETPEMRVRSIRAARRKVNALDLALRVVMWIPPTEYFDLGSINSVTFLIYLAGSGEISRSDYRVASLADEAIAHVVDVVSDVDLYRDVEVRADFAYHLANYLDYIYRCTSD